MRPTESRTVFLQQLGRGLRLHPDTEVLTVLDFVSNHGAALVPLQALTGLSLKQTAALWNVDAAGLSLLAPPGCEILLEDRTREVLRAIETGLKTRSEKQILLDSYHRLRAELGDRPRPLDFDGQNGRPTFAELRGAFQSWLGVRHAAGDTDTWEDEASHSPALAGLLQAAEKDYGQAKIDKYAALWSLVASPDDPRSAVMSFFDRWPQWRVEQSRSVLTASPPTKGHSRVPELLNGAALRDDLRALLRADTGGRILQEFEDRLDAVLASDYARRHAGVLRTPAELVLHDSYRREDVANHLGMPYRRGKHGTGIIRADGHIALLAQLNTSDAALQHRYVNAFLDHQRFAWHSQATQRSDHGSGSTIAAHRERGITLHLFVQGRGSHLKATYAYLGTVQVAHTYGQTPFTAELHFDHPATPALLHALGVDRSSGS